MINKFKFLTILVSTLLFVGCGEPPEDTTKTIAFNYGHGAFEKSDINIVKSYEKDGKTVMILKINNALCDMPMLKVDGEWIATAFSCQGSFLSSKETVAILQEGDEPSYQKKSPRKTDSMEVGPILSLDDFTVSLADKSSRRYLKARMNLELENEKVVSEVNTKKAVIRDVIIRLLSSKQLKEISTAKGKETLKDQIVSQLNLRLKDGDVRNVYFEEFIVQ